MAIDVEWQDERGRQIVRYDGPPIDHRLPQRASSTSACLRFIDPYGDTVFNASQVAVLVEELGWITDGSDEVAHQARSLLEFVQALDDRTHLYLRFIGD